MTRWIRFSIALGVGIGLGLYYAWLVNPVQVIDASLDTLRIDYRTDYTLMVAEIYQVELDASLAARRLARLGSDPPAQIVQQAIIFAEAGGYGERDRLLLVHLRDVLQTWNPAPGELSP